MILHSDCAGSIEARPKLTPVIKWPGGKRKLASVIATYLPPRIRKYYEPFVGGGALFFAVRPSKAVLSDLNDDLINFYIVLREQPAALVATLKTLPNSEAHYYKIRQWRPRTDVRRAARFFYLTRLSFNGIHRVNLNGEFNVPYGQKAHLQTYDEDSMFLASAALQEATLMTADFEISTDQAGKGDVVYFDPPYTVAHGLNGFVKYNERIFSWDDQERLAAHARALVSKGCRVLVSNADHPSVRRLYDGFNCHVIERFSVMSANRDHRRQISECLFIGE